MIPRSCITLLTLQQGCTLVALDQPPRRRLPISSALCIAQREDKTRFGGARVPGSGSSFSKESATAALAPVGSGPLLLLEPCLAPCPSSVQRCFDFF
ncbi:hypothetical protein EXIGLDRAFT_65408 [Exidia glandulosa HHB12029]|uniref:Uncharacterized protein n=1 Tax=Exidia glandulosa HHB12029 TaxID=1314781 RepID=A0A165P2G3_EXIGL|nr:hypothetical protein EXIGLDRAFT_65408 [Exidia glandulosa HHB12029]